jgi:protein-disulfide isomerase
MKLSEPPQIQDEDFVIFRRSHFYSVLVVLAFAVGVLVGYMAWGRGGAVAAVPAQAAAAADNPVQNSAPTPTPEIVRYDIPWEGYPAIGPEDAEIVIVEFSDYQCPYCLRWHQQVYNELMAAYPGKIRLVYRNLPLTSIHPEAMPAAIAAECAGDQNAYWPYHDALFSGKYELGQDAYKQYASDLGLDMAAFEICLVENPNADAIQADMDFAINLGIRSTPTFFVNGLAIVGAQPIEVFKSVIDRELAGEIP